jgi:glycosyltransferase involved in cell wall biosynthesis
VNDASTDTSESVIRSLAQDDSKVKLITHNTNKGQVKALQTGLLASNGKIVFFATCDLQNPLSSIGPIYNAIANEGYDLGVAYREKHMDKTMQSQLSRAYFYILQLLFPKLPKGGFDYGAMHHSLSDRLRTSDFDRILIQLEVLRLSKRTYFHPIVRSSDLLDSSGWTLREKVDYGMRFMRYLSIKHWLVGAVVLGVLMLLIWVLQLYS